MTMTLQKVLTEALEDEFKSLAMYRKAIQKFGPVRPFIDIVEAEERHISVLLPPFEKYAFPIPEDNWDSFLQAPDIARVLTNLQSAARPSFAGV